MAKTKKAEQTATVVYCGPTIPGVAKQFTSYTNGLPAPLVAAIQNNPPMDGLMVTLEQLPDAMKQLNGRVGHIYRLYRLVQAENQ